MSSRTLYRLSGLALLVGSILMVLYQGSQAFINEGDPKALAGTLAVGGGVIGLVGALLVLLGLPTVYIRQAHRSGVIGLIAIVFVWYIILFQGVLIPFTSVTILPMLASNPATQPLVMAGPPPAFTPFWIVSLIGQTLGILLLAVTTLRAGIFPRWIVWLLIAALVAAILGNLPFAPGFVENITGVISCLTLAAFGYALLMPEASGQDEPVSLGREAAAHIQSKVILHKILRRHGAAT